MGGEQNAQRNRKLHDPLPNRHARDHLIDQVDRRLGDAPRAARGTKPTPLTGKRNPLLVSALATTQPKEAVRQDAALKNQFARILEHP
jgi:hypothetical protein